MEFCCRLNKRSDRCCSEKTTSISKFISLAMFVYTMTYFVLMLMTVPSMKIGVALFSFSSTSKSLHSLLPFFEFVEGSSTHNQPSTQGPIINRAGGYVYNNSTSTKNNLSSRSSHRSNAAKSNIQKERSSTHKRHIKKRSRSYRGEKNFKGKHRTTKKPRSTNIKINKRKKRKVKASGRQLHRKQEKSEQRSYMESTSHELLPKVDSLSTNNSRTVTKDNSNIKNDPPIENIIRSSSPKLDPNRSFDKISSRCSHSSTSQSSTIKHDDSHANNVHIDTKINNIFHKSNNHSSIDPKSSPLYNTNRDQHMEYTEINQHKIPNRNTSSSGSTKWSTTSNVFPPNTNLNGYKKINRSPLPFHTKLHTHVQASKTLPLATTTTTMSSTNTFPRPSSITSTRATTTSNANTTTATTSIENAMLRPFMLSTTPWVRKYLASRPHDKLLPIPHEFLTDGFNLARIAPIVEQMLGDKYIVPNNKANTSSNGVNKAQPITCTPKSLYRLGLDLLLHNGEEEKEKDRTYGISQSLLSSSSSIYTMYSQNVIQAAAEIIYVCVHARFVSSPRGMDLMRRLFLPNFYPPRRSSEKSNNIVSDKCTHLETPAPFGRCMRRMCKGTPLLPCGFSDCPNSHLNFYKEEIANSVGRHYDEIRGECGLFDNMDIDFLSKRYCFSCGETFNVWESKVDGCAWGTSFCHLFLMTHGKDIFPCLSNEFRDLDKDIANNSEHLRLDKLNTVKNPTDPMGMGTPKIFGFGIHPNAYVRYPTQRGSSQHNFNTSS